jgi:hypothetical protein
LKGVSDESIGELKHLLKQVESMGCRVEPGKGGISIKAGPNATNLLSLRSDWTLRNYGIGLEEFGEEYLDKLAEILGEGFVHIAPNGFHSTVKRISGQYFSIDELLRKREDWMSLVEETIEQLTAK